MTPESYVATPLPHRAELLAFLRADRPLTVFDIGCHDGLDSIRYARLFPAARIYAFEPLPAVFAAIDVHLAAFGCDRVTAFRLALSDRRGEADFHVSSGVPDDERALDARWDHGNKSSSLLPPDRYPEIAPWLRFATTIRVPTERLDAFCSEHGIDRIDFVHLDVQGAELRVLAGAGRLLEAIEVVWLEVKTVPLYEDQPLKADVEAFMSAAGFRKVKDTVGEVTGDQLWVNSRRFGA